jgi:predicted nucleic acid-binding Zn ribbon protein
MTDIEKAERMGRARALIMALAAAVLIFNVWLQYGDAEYASAGGRGGSWLVLIGLWTFILWNGGGLRPGGRVRALLNDELSLQNRSRAFSLGFYAAILLALACYVGNWLAPIAAGDALKIVSAGAISAALLRYAWLEWRLH